MIHSMKFSKAKIEFFSIVGLLTSSTTFISGNRTGAINGSGGAENVLTIGLAAILAISFTSYVLLYRHRSVLRIRFNSINSIAFLYLISTISNRLFSGADYRSVSIDIWITFLVFSVLLCVTLNNRLLRGSGVENIERVALYFGGLYIMIGLFALSIGVERQIQGVADISNQFFGRSSILALPTFSSHNIGAMFVATIGLLFITRRHFKYLVPILVLYFLYVGARVAIFSFFIGVLVFHAPKLVRSYSKYPILALPVILIPIVLYFDVSTFDSSSPYGALNGRETIWRETLENTRNLGIGQILFGSGMFGHLASGNYHFDYMFPESAGVQLLHNAYAQAFFDLGLFGVALLLYLMLRVFQRDRVGAAIATFFSLSASTETVLLPYYPSMFILFILTCVSILYRSSR